MKPIINLSRNILILCLCMVVLAGLHCRRRSDRASVQESKITIWSEADERILGPSRDENAKFLVFLPLVSLDEDREPQGRLAQRWEHSPDYREWTFHLRQDVRWHDSVPVTADDIKFSMELLSHPDVLLSYSWLDAKITARDDYTLAITFSKPTDPLDWWDVYYPKHLLEDLDPKRIASWKFWTEPVGNGPYRYVRHVPRTMIELEANPDYYLGKPKIERVVFKFGGNPLIELLSGNVDLVSEFNPIDIPKVAEDERFRVYHSVWSGWINAIWWNHRHPFFGDSRVRRALTLAINRRELHQVLNLPDDLPIFDVVCTGRQFRRGELPEPLPYDPELAKQLLEEGGWHDEDRNGIRERAGQEFRFTAIVTGTAGADDRSVQVATYIQDQFRRVGVRMEIQPFARGAGLRGRDFEARFGNFLNGMGSEITYHGIISFFGAGQEESLIGYENPEVIALLEEAKKTTVPEEREPIYQKLMPIIRADVPVTFLYPQVKTEVAHRRIRGLSSGYFRPFAQGDMEHLWIEEEENGEPEEQNNKEE
ncbi:MAG: ABC transporter substrate-binding protein [Planctomycetota bacterium]